MFKEFDVCSRISWVRSKMEEFDFMFSLMLGTNIMTQTDNLSRIRWPHSLALPGSKYYLSCSKNASDLACVRFMF